MSGGADDVREEFEEWRDQLAEEATVEAAWRAKWAQVNAERERNEARLIEHADATAKALAAGKPLPPEPQLVNIAAVFDPELHELRRLRDQVRAKRSKVLAGLLPLVEDRVKEKIDERTARLAPARELLKAETADARADHAALKACRDAVDRLDPNERPAAGSGLGGRTQERPSELMVLHSKDFVALVPLQPRRDDQPHPVPATEPPRTLGMTKSQGLGRRPAEPPPAPPTRPGEI